MLLSALILAAAATPELEWFDGPLISAVGVAENHHKDVMIYFWRNGSEHCASFYGETLQSESVAASLEDYVLVSANYDNHAGSELFAKYGVSTLPTLMILKQGEPDDLLAGYLDAEGLRKELDRIRRGEGTLSGLQAKVEVSQGAEAIEARFRLAGKYLDLGRKEPHDALLTEIRAMDPDAETRAGIQAHIWQLQEEITAPLAGLRAEGAEDHLIAKRRRELDYGPLVSFAKRVKTDEARFEAWKSVGQMEVSREGYEPATKAFRSAWKNAPLKSRFEFSRNLAHWVFEMEQPEKNVAKFGAEMAKNCLSTLQDLDPESEAYHVACGEASFDHVVAQHKTMQALILVKAGDERKARKVAREVVRLSDDEGFREALSEIL